MTLADDIAYMSAAEMARRIRRRDFSPVEMVETTIRRVEARNPSLNAFVFKGYDDGRQAAKQAEKALLGSEPLGSCTACRPQLRTSTISSRAGPILSGGIVTPSKKRLYRHVLPTS
jgi:amidase